MGIPIPILYLCEEEDGTYSVIDGQQRILSFVRYLKNEYALVGLTNCSDLNELYYKDLPKPIQRSLKSKTLHVITILKDSKDLKYEIFSRLNLGAVKLKDQEVRNCIYRGSFNSMLKDLAENCHILKKLFNDENTRFAYEERILRFFALRNYLELHGTFKKLMNTYMEKHQNDEPAQLEKMRNQYVSLVDTVYTIMGDNAFFSLDKDRRRKFNGAVYDSIIIPFSYYPSKALLQHADDLRAQINLLKENNAEYKENTYAGTNSGTRVRGRIEQIKEIIDRIIAQDAAPSQKRCFDEDIKQKLFYPGYKCCYCGNTILSPDMCEVDHIIPFSKGGTTTIENAQLLHRSCNRQKGAALPTIMDAMIDDSDDDKNDDES